MDDYVAAVKVWMAELDEWLEAARAKLKDDEKLPEQPPLSDSPTD